jgi:hypothetical protein
VTCDFSLGAWWRWGGYRIFEVFCWGGLWEGCAGVASGVVCLGAVVTLMKMLAFALSAARIEENQILDPVSVPGGGHVPNSLPLYLGHLVTELR